MAKRFKLRRLIVFAHRWVGLFVAVFLIVEGVTGSLLAFRAELTRFLDPSAVAVPPHRGAVPLPAGELAQRVDAHLAPLARVAYFFPTPEAGQQVVRVAPRIDPRTGEPFEIDYGIVVVDPWTGRELKRAPFEGYSGNFVSDLMPFVYQLHITLALGGLGYWLLGVVALLWTFDCIWSIYLTFPGRRRGFFAKWRRAWIIRWPPSTAFRLNFDLHRASGLWTWLLLLAFAWSSVALTLMPVYDAVTGALFDYRTPDQEFAGMPRHDPARSPSLGWVEAQARGDVILADIARREGFRIERPTTLAYLAENGIYSYEVRTSRRFPQFENLGIYFDGDTGQLVRVLRPNGEHAGNTLTNWLRGLHLIGDPVDYAPYRWAVFMLGWIVALLSGTGVYIWLCKRRGRVNRRAGLTLSLR